MADRDLINAAAKVLAAANDDGAMWKHYIDGAEAVVPFVLAKAAEALRTEGAQFTTAAIFIDRMREATDEEQGGGE